MTALRLLLLLALASPVYSAPPTLSVPAAISGKPGAFIAIEAESDSPWVNFRASDGLNVFPAGLLASKKATVVTGPEGTYRVWAYAGNEDGGVDREIVVTIGNAPPPPVVVPPVVVPPVVVPPAPVAGKRQILIIHESASDDPAVGGMLIQLRNGEPAKYLKEKGHQLYELDDDDVDEARHPTPLVEKWRPHYAGMKLPAVFIITDKGELVHKQELPTGTKAAAVIDLVKAKGG